MAQGLPQVLPRVPTRVAVIPYTAPTANPVGKSEALGFAPMGQPTPPLGATICLTPTALLTPPLEIIMFLTPTALLTPPLEIIMFLTPTAIRARKLVTPGFARNTNWFVIRA